MLLFFLQISAIEDEEVIYTICTKAEMGRMAKVDKRENVEKLSTRKNAENWTILSYTRTYPHYPQKTGTILWLFEERLRTNVL